MEPRSLLAEFRAEVADHLAALDAQLLQLERDPSDAEAVRRMFLAAHTIKGDAAMVGLVVIRDLAHAMEEVLAFLRDRRGQLEPHTADLLFRAVDELLGLLEAPELEATEPTASIAELEAALRQAAGGAPANQLSGMPPAESHSGRPRALLVEHSATARTLETLELADAGFDVDAFASGEEGLVQASQVRYDLVVTSIETGEVRGFDLVSALRRSPVTSSVPTIIVSSDENARNQARAAELGAVYLLRGAAQEGWLLDAARGISRGDR